MSRQALDSEKLRQGLRDMLLGPANLYEALRSRGEAQSVRPPGGKWVATPGGGTRQRIDALPKSSTPPAPLDFQIAARVALCYIPEDPGRYFAGGHRTSSTAA
ncbi:MAG: hypothetical protein HQL90_05285 [Magnetococcales bacterium]|nr:hypothetical protein [Magnetococcales bacterium]